MKINFLVTTVSLFVTMHCSSQITAQKKTSTKTPAAINPVVKQNTFKKTAVTIDKLLTTPNANEKVDSSKATLGDASFSVTTERSYNEDPGTNKAANTRWSCTLFDQNNRQVASFYDDSNNDEYASGTQTPVLKMQVDNATVLGDFSKGGRLHISITPNENDTWEISDFNLTIDFHDPIFTQKLTWNGIKLSQDKKDVDLFFNNNGGNSDLKYDLKANKPG